MIERAISFAAIAHEGQKDKAGMPYILHPLAVMQSVSVVQDDELREKLQVVAVLHDVVEDTLRTLEGIEIHFGNEIAEAVDAITKRKGEKYAAYLKRVKGNALAVIVKWFDMKHNSSEARLAHLDPGIQEYLRKKYRAGMAELEAIVLATIGKLTTS